MSELPKGWAETTLGDIGIWRGGGTPSKSKEEFWQDGYIPWVSPKDMKRDFIDDTEDHITKAAVEQSATQIITSPSVLVVTRSGILRHSLPVAVTTREVAINQDIKGLTLSNGIDAEFVLRQLRSEAQSILQECSKSGTTVDSIDFERLKARTFLVAPLLEQRRIVAKLDSLFARSRRARAELERVSGLCDRYRQAVLAAAFQGELTADWRRENRLVILEKNETLTDRQIDILPSLPDDWSWKTMGQVAEITGGLTKNQNRAELEKKVPYLRVANVYANELRLEEILEIGIAETEWQRVLLKAEDLLIVEGNGSIDQIGRVALWDGQIEPCAHQNHLIKARAGSDLVPKFALYWLLSPSGRRAIELVASSSAGLHTLSISKVSALPIPICSTEEMKVVVEKVETLFSTIAQIEADHKKALALCDRLDQAILTQAFSGNLVPQDPTDEPASALLERIQAEKQETPTRKKAKSKPNSGAQLHQP